MGCYVEVFENKKDWLFNNSDGFYSVNKFPKWEEMNTKKTLPVVLCDNGIFYAVGVAFDKQEYERFTYPEDERDRQVFLVSIEKLKKVSDVENYLKWSKEKQKQSEEEV